jgi:hypothetical protein
MAAEEYGTRLKELMANNQDHVCNPRCLSNALDLTHTNEVNAWLRNHHAPKLSSEHIGAISRHLKLTSAQRKDLHEAQVRKLQEHHKSRTKRDANRQSDPAPPKASLPLRFASTFGKAVGEDIIRLLEEAPDGTGRDDDANTITITWRSGSLVQQTEAQRDRWRMALQSILRRGWQVRYLCQLDKNTYRTVGLVQHMLDYIGLGMYVPRYFTTSYNTAAAPTDLVVIPGFAAAWLYSTSGEQRTDAGIIVREPRQLRTIALHVRQLEKQTAPLIKAPSAFGDNAQSVAAIGSAEAHAGGRRLFKNGLSAFTQPLWWFEETATPSAAETRMAPDTWRVIRDNQRKRIEAFRRYVKRYDYFDICPLSALTSLVEEGAYPRDDILLPRVQPLTRCLEHLTNARDILRENERYHIGFVDADQPAPGGGTLGRHLNRMWQVTGNGDVFLGTWVLGADGQLISVNLHITEQTVAQGFREYFDQMWSMIAPSNREREAVLDRLDREIEKLAARIEAAGE